MGGVLFAFGLAPIAMGVWFIRESFDHFGPGPGVMIVGQVLMLLPLALFLAFGGLLWLLGVWLLAGRAEIVQTPDEISGGFRLGPLVWRGRRRRGLVRRLVVERSSRGPGPGADLASLSAETDSGQPLVLALVYSPDLLVPLAADLARRWDEGDGPLPVVERVSGQASSRRWRRDRPPEGPRPTPRWFLIVWGSGFFAAGVFAFVLILQALVRGDPDDHLQGAYPWKCLWILFPLPFAVPGAGALLYAFGRRQTAGLSPEHLKAAEASPPPPVDEAGGVGPSATPLETEYPTIPAAGRAPRAELAARLVSAESPGYDAVTLLVVLVLCSGVLTPLANFAVRALRDANWEWGPVTAIFSAILGFMWVAIAVAVVKAYRQWRVGCPVVEVSAQPLYCGDDCEVVVTVPGPAALPRLRIAVLCEEGVSFADGDGTTKETRRVYEQELACREGLAVEGGEPFRVRGVFHVPAGAMHSFKAGHSEVRWLVRIEGEARRPSRVPFSTDYLLEVRPRRAAGETT
jgi:hypothetical protein